MTPPGGIPTSGGGIPRNYVSRRGHLTSAQRRALERLGPRYFASPPLHHRGHDAESLFGRRGPLYVEIGSGNGHFLTERARCEPHDLHLGIELYPPGLGHSLLLCERHDLDNVRLAREDAELVLEGWLANASATGVIALFPDPWPKKRHHKRRLLLRPGFLDQVARILVDGGSFFLFTDAPDYAQEVREHLRLGPWEPMVPEETLLLRARETPFARRALVPPTAVMVKKRG